MQSATPDILADLRTRFDYRSEESDRWNLLTAPAGPLRGDCDDFALTALWLLSGQSWLRLLWLVLTFQMMLWHVRTRADAPHMALWVRGRGWVCNIYPAFGPSRHSLRFPYLLPVFLAALARKYRGRK